MTVQLTPHLRFESNDEDGDSLWITEVFGHGYPALAVHTTQEDEWAISLLTVPQAEELMVLLSAFVNRPHLEGKQ